MRSLHTECYSFNLHSLQSVTILPFTYVFNHFIITQSLISIDLISHSFKLKYFFKTKYIPEREIKTGRILIHLYFSLFIYTHVGLKYCKLKYIVPFRPKLLWLRCWQNVISVINNVWWLYGTWNKNQILFQFIIPKIKINFDYTYVVYIQIYLYRFFSVYNYVYMYISM